MTKKYVKVWEVCYSVEFRSDYVYENIKADTEDEAIDLARPVEAAEDVHPEVDAVYLSHVELVDEYEVDDEEDETEAEEDIL